MDRARTALEGSGITSVPATAPSDLKLQSNGRLIQGLAVLANLGMFVAVAIAALSLAVATASAVLDRKRVLGLMRLMVTGINDAYRVAWPSPGYFTALGLSLVLALGTVTATFGLIRDSTATAATRFD